MSHDRRKRDFGDVDVVGLYRQGYSSVEIANRIGGETLPQTVLMRLKEAGEPIRIGGRRDRDTHPAPLRYLPKPVPEPPAHCICKRPVFGYPVWGVRPCKKCGKPEQ